MFIIDIINIYVFCIDENDDDYNIEIDDGDYANLNGRRDRVVLTMLNIDRHFTM